MALLLVAFGNVPFDTVTVYGPASDVCTFDRVKLDEVAPEIVVPFLYHW
jgi:hypothetical protein